MRTSSLLTNELPKASPDISKLAGMTSRIVQVTKYTSKNGAGQSVYSATKGKQIDEIVDLHKTLPVKWGPGTYKFEVFDEGGPEKDTWTVRLGNEEGSSMAESNGVAAVNAPLSADVVNLGHGWLYNESLGLLTTPRGIFPWTRGTPLPPEVTGTSLPIIPASTSSQQQPGGFSQMPGGFSSGMPGWGHYPVMPDTNSNKEVELLREQIKMLGEERKNQEFAKSISELKEGFAETIKTIVGKLDNNNKGPSAEMQELQRRLEKAEQDAKEARREAEEKRREDMFRAELKANQDRTDALLRELAANSNKGPDPMMSMLTQIITSSQAAGAETIRAIKEASVAQASAVERSAQTASQQLAGSIMTPQQTIDMLRFAKDSSSSNDVVNKGMIDMFQSLFGMAKGLVRDQAEMYGQGQGPAWMPIAQAALEKVGTVAQAIAATKEASKAETEHRTVVLQQQQMERARSRRVRVVHTPPAPQVPQQVAAVPAAPEKPETPSEMRARFAKEVHGEPVVNAAAAQQEPEAPPEVELVSPGDAHSPEEAPASANVAPISTIPGSEVRKMVDALPDDEYVQLYLSIFLKKKTRSLTSLTLWEGTFIRSKSVRGAKGDL